ncbi:phytanoyl-CoA dioxygenase family protein [Haliangium sp. UPWRP_2]|uniref:phytanoyl-CoA dioxygenase family protein n=1 Tax=Haliangium sp. UPWRP_2 TaxID=1931276 RepID=UPI001304FEF9|nr:phytanoyl-CoA dioxygenase family protein [Haliangium sp. UPWRP_2]
MSANSSDPQYQQLERDGFLTLRNLISPAEIDRLNAHLDALWEQEGEQAGAENVYSEPGVRRLANLANKGEVFRPLYSHPQVLAAVRSALGERIALIMFNAREVPPSPTPRRQDFHCDTDPLWNGGVPDSRGYLTCTAVWLLTDSTAENGATRALPGTHRSGLLPQAGLADLFAPHPDEVVLSGMAGDLVLLNGNCWHCGGANYQPTRRRALLAHYKRSDLRRADYRYKDISKEVRARLTEEERQLLECDTDD